MNRPQFITLTSLSVAIAVCLLLQIVFSRISAADEIRLGKTEEALKQGQLCFTRLQQVAGRIAQVSQQQNDQALKDLLTRQNIQIKAPAATGTASSPAAPETPAAPSTR